MNTKARPRWWARVTLAAGLGVLASLTPSPATTRTAWGAVEDNPDLPVSCGIDVVLVLDESSSIRSENAVDDVEESVRALVDGLKGTGSRLRLAEFSTNARDASIGGSTGFQEVDNAFDSAVETYLTGHPTNQTAQTATSFNPGYGDLYTNWEAGLARADGVGDAGPGDLVVFVTDGQPNTVGTSGNSTGGAAGATAAAAAAHDELNLIKGAGVHVLGIGVGAAANDSNFNLLVDTIDPDPNETWLGTGPLDIRTVDAIRVDSFDALDDALRSVVFALCAPSVTISKADDTGAAVSGWNFTGNVDVAAGTGQPDTYEWVSPTRGVATDDGTGNDAGTTTGTTSLGTALFQWTPGSVADPMPYESTFKFSETLPAGWLVAGAQTPCNVERLNNDGSLTTLTDVVLAYTQTGDVVSFELQRDGAPFVISPSDIVTCPVVNMRPRPPLPRVVKGLVTGADTVATVGEPGGSVTIPVTVYNDAVSPQGDAVLTSLVDDIYGDIATTGHDGITATTCSLPQTIAGGGSYSCTFTVDITSPPGTITDTVTATLVNPARPSGVTASDQAKVVVTDRPSAIEVVKTASPTTVLEPGGDVMYTFEVRNLASSADQVTITEMVDTVFGDLDGQGTCSLPQTLDPGESYTCSLTTRVSGNAGAVHDNVVVASGHDDDGVPVSDDDEATVTITDVPPDIAVTKTADPVEVAEPGGDVTFTFVVENLGVEDVTLHTLTDSVYGDLDGQGTCVLPQTIAVGGSYSCQITKFVSGDADDAPHVNVVTAVASDDEDNSDTATDDASVTVTDVPSSISLVKTAEPTSVPETGADVTFTFTVNNLSTADSVTIESMTDTVYGDLTAAPGTTCVLPQTIAAGGSYSCSITVFVQGDTGQTHTNVATAAGVDDDGDPVEASDDAVVTITDTPSSIVVTKTAAPTQVPETGGEVTFTVLIENTSAVDAVTITTLTDSVFGNLDGKGTCSLPQTIPAGGSYSCSFSAVIAGDAPGAHVDVVTAAGVDDDGVAVSDDDDAVVDLTDVLPDITVTKTADPVQVPEPGGEVTFTIVVTNVGPEAVTLDSLVDSVFGDLDGQGTCVLPQALAAGGSYTCSITKYVAGQAGRVHRNTVGAMATDDDGNGDTATDDAAVTFTDVPSAIEIVKTVSPTSVPEPGGQVTFTFVIDNLSAVDAVTITSLTDTVFGDLNGQGTCVLPQTIAAGGSYSCSITKYVAGTENQVHTNVVTARGVDDDGVPVTDDDDAQVAVTGELPADLQIVKTASVPIIGPDGEFQWTLTIANLGPAGATARNVEVSDVVPSALKITSVSSQQMACTVSGNTVTCTKASMAAGETAQVVISVKVRSDAVSGTLSNVGTVRSDTPDPNPGNNTDDAVVEVVGQLPPTPPPTPPTVLPPTGSSWLNPLVGVSVALLLAGTAVILLARWRAHNDG